MDNAMVDSILALITSHNWAVVIGVAVVCTFIKLFPALQGRAIRFINSDLIGSKPVSAQTLISGGSFSVMDELIAYGIDSISISNKFKDKVAKDFLKMKLKIFRDGFMEFVKRPEVFTLSGDCLKAEVTTLFFGLINKYEEKAVADGIPQLFIEKFHAWHDPATQEVKRNIDALCTSNYITTNGQKLNAILINLSSAFYRTLIDAERTLGDINGHMKGLVYKGIVCE